MHQRLRAWVTDRQLPSSGPRLRKQALGHTPSQSRPHPKTVLLRPEPEQAEASSLLRPLAFLRPEYTVEASLSNTGDVRDEPHEHTCACRDGSTCNGTCLHPVHNQARPQFLQKSAIARKSMTVPFKAHIRSGMFWRLPKHRCTHQRLDAAPTCLDDGKSPVQAYSRRGQEHHDAVAKVVEHL